MDLTGLRTLVRDVNFAALGVLAEVTPPSELTRHSRIIWLDSSVEIPQGAEFQRTERRRAAAIPTQDGPLDSGGVPAWEGVPAVPRGTLIEILPATMPPVVWRVDGIERVAADHVRAVVVAD